MRRWWTDALGAAAVVLGVAVEPFSAGPGWVPDLLTGWGLAACAVAARRSRVGWLLAAAAVLWFAAWPGALAYRAPLTLAVLTPPERLRPSALDIAVALALAVTVLGQSLAAALALAAVAVGAGALRRDALSGAAVLGATFAGGAIVTHALGGEATVAVTTVYGAGLVVAAAVTALAVSRGEWELTETLAAGDTVEAFRDALAAALADPALRVEFAGAPLGERVTVIEEGGEPVAWLAHRDGAFADPAVFAAVAGATRLQAANVRLQHDLALQAEALAGSGRRLLAAGDEQRRRLERRVRAGPLARLEALDTQLEALGSPALERARGDLADSLEELRTLAFGLHPGTDVGAATATLSARSPVPVDAHVGALPDLPAAVCSALVFTCGEALANVAKHAAATRVELRLGAAAGCVTLSVADDGRGGADPTGSGLAGLRDRLELLGGTLAVTSEAGTRLVASLPIGR